MVKKQHLIAANVLKLLVTLVIIPLIKTKGVAANANKTDSYAA